MTKKQIEKLPDIIAVLISESVLVDTKEKLHEKLTEVCNLAIEALEQEPCDDAISRQAVLDAIDVKAWEFCDYLISKNRNDEQKPVSHFADNLRECVREELPSVKPQPKTGEWIGDAKTYYEELNKRGLGVDEYTPYFTDDIACSECLAKYSMLDNETQFFKYCPNCGAKMVESQEWSNKK